MPITELLSEQQVIPALNGQTKDSVLRELVEALVVQHPEIDRGRLLEVLEERERLGSTGIAEGVAIPHGKLPGLPRVLAVFGRHQAGVDFQSLDGSPTKLFFLLVAPTEAASQHLKALAGISRLVRDAAFRNSLIGARDQRELYQRILAHERNAQGVRA